MLPTLAPLAALLLSMGILLLGGGLLGTLLAVRMGLEGIGAGTIGVVMACYSVGFVLATLVCHRVIQKVGHIRAFAALAAVAACAALVHGLHVHAVLWAAMRVVFGFAVAGLYMVTESWLNDQTPRQVRGRVLGVYVVMTSVALGGGQFLINVWDVEGHELFSLAAILLAAALIPVALARVPSPELRPAKRVRLGELYAISPLATVTSLAAGITNGGFFFMGPVFAVNVGFSTGAVGLFMGSAILGGLVLQFLIGRLSDLVDRRRMIVGVCGVVTLVSIAIALLRDQAHAVLIALVIVWGGINFTIYALSLALANDFMEPEERVPAGATMLLMHGTGMIIGPLALSQAMRLLGPEGLFLGFATVTFAVALFGWYRNRVGVPIEARRQQRYQVAPHAGHSTAYGVSLDPGAEAGEQLEFDFDAREPDYWDDDYWRES